MATQIADRTTAERVSRLEGAYEHLPTKADIAQMESRIVRWMVTVVVVSATLSVTIATVLNNLLTAS